MLFYQVCGSGKARVKARALREEGRFNEPELEDHHSLFPHGYSLFSAMDSPNKGSSFFSHQVLSHGLRRDLPVETEVDFPAGSGEMGSLQHCSSDSLWSQPPRLGKALGKRLLEL